MFKLKGAQFVTFSPRLGKLESIFQRENLIKSNKHCAKASKVHPSDGIKLGFHIIVWIVPIIPIVSKCVQAIGTIIWKCPKKIRDDRDDRDRPDRLHFYPGDRDDRKFCRRSNGNRFQTIRTIGTIQNCPRMQVSNWRHNIIIT